MNLRVLTLKPDADTFHVNHSQDTPWPGDSRQTPEDQVTCLMQALMDREVPNLSLDMVASLDDACDYILGVSPDLWG